jgi:hypothetical protein
VTSPRPPGPDAPFTLRRLFGLWLPLAFTFLLMSGSSPIVTRGIATLPGAKAGLAAFCDAFRVAIFLHAPTFVVRDIAIRSVRDRRSYHRVLRFTVAVSAVCTVLELVVALTPAGDWLLGEVVRTPPELVAMTKRAILPFAALPLLLSLRGVHQGVHIRGETTRWVGIGTALRLGGIAVFALVLAPHLGIEAAVMGSLCFVVALIVEVIVNTTSAHRVSPILATRDTGEDDGTMGALARFALPLMIANLGGVLFQPLVSRVAGAAGDPETSKAALQVLISWVWFFSSTIFAMQALAIAHATRERLGTLVRFGVLVAAGFSAVFTTVALLPPARDFVLRTIFNVHLADVRTFVSQALPLAIGFPILVLLRALLRGLIVRSGRTGWVMLTTAAGLLALFVLDRFGLVGGEENGTIPAVQAWLAALIAEAAISAVALARIGLRKVFGEDEAGESGGPRR